MSKISRFEDLIAWQKARELVKEIYELTQKGAFAEDFGLSKQIQRAAVSIMSNLAEGFERASRADFHRFIVTAKGSCAEVRSQLYIALDNGYLSEFEFQRIFKRIEELGKIIGGLRVAVAKQRDRIRG